jgi:hypothetical protein
LTGTAARKAFDALVAEIEHDLGGRILGTASEEQPAKWGFLALSAGAKWVVTPMMSTDR